MVKLEGITELRGKNVVLENIENPKLRAILHSRLKEEGFNFHSEYKEDYTQYTDKEPSKHKDYHSDNHTDRYNDSRHRDSTESTWGDMDIDSYNTGHSESHLDKGYSERTNYGYSEHIDHY